MNKKFTPAQLNREVRILRTAGLSLPELFEVLTAARRAYDLLGAAAAQRLINAA